VIFSANPLDVTSLRTVHYFVQSLYCIICSRQPREEAVGDRPLVLWQDTFFTMFVIHCGCHTGIYPACTASGQRCRYVARTCLIYRAGVQPLSAAIHPPRCLSVVVLDDAAQPTEIKLISRQSWLETWHRRPEIDIHYPANLSLIDRARTGCSSVKV